MEIIVTTDLTARQLSEQINPNPQDPYAMVLGGDNPGELVVIVANSFYGRLVCARLDQENIQHKQPKTVQPSSNL